VAGFVIAQNKTFMILEQIQIIHVDGQSSRAQCRGILFFPCTALLGKCAERCGLLRKGRKRPAHSLQEIYRFSRRFSWFM